jgi:hypothetical protein
MAVGIAAARNIGCRHGLELSPQLGSADDEIEQSLEPVGCMLRCMSPLLALSGPAETICCLSASLIGRLGQALSD